MPINGKASRSYGIQVAALAGVPKQVVQRAQEILTNIERGEFTPAGEPTIAVSGKKQGQQLSLFPPKEDKLRKLLEGINPDELTPRQAQELVYELMEEVMKRG